jgi:ribosomal protein L32
MITTQKCKSCQKKLYRDVWNSKLDIFTCQNDHCPLFRQPQGYIPDAKNAKLFAPLSKAEVGRRNRADRAAITRNCKAWREKAHLPKKYVRHIKSRPELFCVNCGAKVLSDRLCPSELARRKRIFCNKACWHEYQRTHPKWKG